VVLKLMLHASKEMQACRLLRRIELIHEKLSGRIEWAHSPFSLGLRCRTGTVRRG
jgi:hypothetical protein